MNDKKLKKVTQVVVRQLTDDGLVIEAGWRSFVVACKLQDAPENQLTQMRAAFFAGALHTFHSIMTLLEPGQEATSKDVARLDEIWAELDRFNKELEIRIGENN